MADLRLDRLDVVHAGDQTFPMAEGIRAVAAGRLLDELAPRGRGQARATRKPGRVRT
jgi:hypothetical protein